MFLFLVKWQKFFLILYILQEVWIKVVGNILEIIDIGIYFTLRKFWRKFGENFRKKCYEKF